jgi:hypothetical protein
MILTGDDRRTANKNCLINLPLLALKFIAENFNTQIIIFLLSGKLPTFS